MDKKIEIIPDHPRDEITAKQMSDLVNWKIVKSKSDKHPDFGYPMGQILCRNLHEAEEVINNSGFTDCFMEGYKNKENTAVDKD